MRRVFTGADQARFAAISGDHNPIHVDPVRARRTIAGEPVVHGVHLLLWALDAFAAGDGGPPPASSLRADFGRFVTLGQPVETIVHRRAADAIHLRIAADGATCCDIVIGLGLRVTETEAITGAAERIAPGTEALDLPLDRIEGLCGRVPFATPAGEIAALFPAAAGWIGARRIAALAASTRLVGMIVPGLHSIYGGLRVDLVDDSDPGEALAFAIGPPRHRLIGARVGGGGIAGTLRALARAAPAIQPGMAELAGIVAPDAFAGSHALIVGGSRGLGELTAKIVATGGGRVAITYRVGAAEAEAVAADIHDAGSVCDVLRYEVGLPAGPQLDMLGMAPTHGYYFATPVIARPNSTFFEPARLRELEAVFVDGFWDFASALRARRPDAALFYPSTVFIDERPKGMAEYAMAKAAGEILCAEINATLAPLRITAARLPRLATDQTAAAIAVSTAPAVDTLLPLIRAVQANISPRPDAR